MNDLQKRTLEIMVKLDRICRDNGITYYLAAGSLLGAVRHGGFIPWDDDLDIYITKYNYERLDQVLNNMDLDSLDLHWTTDRNDPAYANNVARVFDTKSTRIQKGLLLMGDDNGCLIDVFVLDDYPDDYALQLDYRKHFWIYVYLRSPFWYVLSGYMPADQLDEKLLNHYLAKVEEDGLDAVLDEVRSHLFLPYENSKLVAVRWHTITTKFPRSLLEETSEIEFEGHRFMTVSEPAELLAWTYSNGWNTIPKKESTAYRTHSLLENMSLPYGDIAAELDRIRAEYDYDGAARDLKPLFKDRFFAALERDRALSLVRREVLRSLAAHYETETPQVTAENYKQYSARYKDFFDILFAFSYAKFGYDVVLSDALLESMLRTLLFENRWKDMKSLMDLCGNPSVCEEYQTIVEQMEAMRAARFSYQTRCGVTYAQNPQILIDEVRRLYDLLVSEYDLADQLEVMRTGVWLQKVDAETGAKPLTLREVKAFAATLRAPKDLEVRKYIADMYDMIGRRDLALPAYRDVMAKSRNGILLKEIRERVPASELAKPSQTKTAPASKMQRLKRKLSKLKKI